MTAPIPARVLLVDDDPRNLLSFASILEQPGLEVVTAVSGAEALEQVLLHDFALILLDVRMPGMDGYEVASIIRGRARSARTPIIFLTAVDKDDVHVFRGYNAGAVDFLFKPPNPTLLRSKVAIFVDLYRMTQEAHAKGESERRLLTEALAAREATLRAETELRRAQERQSRIQQALSFIVGSRLAAAPYEMRYISENCDALTGFSAAQMTAGDAAGLDRVHPNDRDATLGAWRGGAQGGRYAVEYRFQRADGEWRTFFEAGVGVLQGETGEMELFCGVMDVTDRRQLQEQLVQSQKMELVGQLTGGIAHDFNNMLAVAIGNLELVERKGGLDARATRRIAQALEASRRCADLTRRLMGFARSQPLERSVVELSAFMAEFEGFLLRAVGPRIRLVIDVPQGGPKLLTDRVQLESALMNLAINARDAMAEGGVLTIRVRGGVTSESDVAPDAGGFVEIAVADTGSGMRAEVIERIFEPFFSTKPVGKGTGLGLSMVHGYVTQQGGRIGVESAPGTGTTVTLRLPEHHGEAAQPTQGAAACDDMRVAEGQRALVVDDEAAVRELVVDLLRRAGFDCVEKADADGALADPDALARVDLIVSDIRMPGRSTGIDLAHAAQDLAPRAAVVLMTGHVEDQPESLPFRVLNKPFSRDAFYACVAEALRQRDAPPGREVRHSRHLAAPS